MTTLEQRTKHIKKLLVDRKDHAEARKLIEEIKKEQNGNLPMNLRYAIDFLNGN